MNKKILFGLIVAVVVIGLGYGGWVWVDGQNKESDKAATTPTPTMAMDMSAEEHAAMNDSVSYQGEEGKTALDLLVEKYPNSKTSGEGAMAFVTEINGRVADTSKNEFWKFLINGEDAQVGAGTYQTKSTDQITWEIDTY